MKKIIIALLIAIAILGACIYCKTPELKFSGCENTIEFSWSDTGDYYQVKKDDKIIETTKKCKFKDLEDGDIYQVRAFKTTFGITTHSKWSRKLYAKSEQMLILVNRARTKRGLNPLEMEPVLNQTALEKSQDMYDTEVFEHKSPNLGICKDQFDKIGISWTTGSENIAKGYTDTEECFDAWMHSKSHREGILNPNYTHFGCARVGTYWTQHFIEKAL